LTAGSFLDSSRAYNTIRAFNYTGGLLNFVANDGYTTDNESVFVHVTYDFTERLRVSGGARYTDEAKTNTFDHGPALNRSDVPLIFGDSRTDWKLVSISADRQVFLYAQAATVQLEAQRRAFHGRQLMALGGALSQEIGASRVPRNRFRLNAAIFTAITIRVQQTGGVNQCDARRA
jgi:hypothetical protein